MRRILYTASLLMLWAGSLFGQTVNLKSDGPVTDAANLFNATERELLRQKLNAYEDSTSNQIVVVTISSLEGMDISQYATELGHQWGVGNKEKDNGVVILVSKNDRKAYIAVGRGLEANIPDMFASRILRNTMMPAFREGQYYQGVNSSVDGLIAAASGAYKAEEVSDEEAIIVLVIILVVFILLIFFFVRMAKRVRKNFGDGNNGGGWGPVIFMPGNSSWGSSSSDSGWGSSSGGSSDFGFGGGDFGGGGAGDSW